MIYFNIFNKIIGSRTNNLLHCTKKSRPMDMIFSIILPTLNASPFHSPGLRSTALMGFLSVKR